MHIGGDEAFGMSDEAHAAFVERAVALVRARGKRVAGRQEIARASIGSDEVVQYWMDVDIDAMSGDAMSSMPPELLPILVEGLQKATPGVPLVRVGSPRLQPGGTHHPQGYPNLSRGPGAGGGGREG